MNDSNLINLNLSCGDRIYIVTKTGEGFHGEYESEYNSSNGTFIFLNDSNGKRETIYLQTLQDLRRA